MSFKALTAVMALSIILLIPSALGEYQVFTLWHHNVSLDFGDKNITVEPQPTTSDINSIMRSMVFRGDSADDWGAAYLLSTRDTVPVILEDRLRRIMMPTAKAVEVNPGLVAGASGLIAEGDARVEHGFGQRCYGASAIISPPGAGEIVTLTLIGHFKNESLNEHLIRTARVEYSPP